jgi:3-hydroxy-9,10-secoandrosta-1,3,5(10)-triene-9,17-dione monooxygenase reductase component
MSFDARTLRDALGLFVTGVTVITARSDSDDFVGVTANSFNSVSMTPPLILWSLGRSSKSIAAFIEASHFCVHILREDQTELATRFATSGIDKFEGMALERGIGGVPMLPDCAARLECETFNRIDGGDHIIFLGEVLALVADHDSMPLLYHGGKYSSLADKKIGL